MPGYNYLEDKIQMLDDVIKKINSLFKPKKIILFGSYAWGMPTKDSDYDLFIIMDILLELFIIRARVTRGGVGQILKIRRADPV